jgi:hypothetical protein
MPRDVRNFVDLALTKRLREQVEERFDKPGAKRALPAEAHVMGRAYSKQSDVVIASWAAGVEVLISTKTMLSSYQKNLRNRFEEGYGDAKNLRGRHPMADQRSVEEEPSALLPLRGEAGDEDAVASASSDSVQLSDPAGSVSVRSDVVPMDLAADQFFGALISRALDRMPVAVYSGVRERRALAAD